MQIQFLLYYRVLFLTFSGTHNPQMFSVCLILTSNYIGWGPTIAAAIVTILIDIVYYPLRMTKFIFDLRFKALKTR